MLPQIEKHFLSSNVQLFMRTKNTLQNNQNIKPEYWDFSQFYDFVKKKTEAWRMECIWKVTITSIVGI